jgi:hypothetical protein
LNGSRPGYLPLSVDRNRLLQIRTDDDISTIRFDAHHHKVPPEYVAALTDIGVKGGGRIDYLHRDPLHTVNMINRQGISPNMLGVTLGKTQSLLAVHQWLHYDSTLSGFTMHISCSARVGEVFAVSLW